MASVLTAFCVALLIPLTSALAGSYGRVFWSVWPDGGAPTHVSALIGAEGEMDGFVFCDSASRQVTIERWSGARTVLSYARTPIASANYVESSTGRVALYVLLTSNRGANQEVLLYIIGEGGAKLTASAPLEYRSLASATLRHSTLSLVNPGGAHFGVKVESIFDEVIDETIGWSEQQLSYSLVLSGDLRAQLFRRNSSRIAVGDLVDDARLEAAFVDEFHSAWQYNMPAVNRSGTEDRRTYGVVTHDDRVLVSRTGENNRVEAVLIADFIPWMPHDEVLIAGDMADLAGNYSGARPHVACYDLSSGAASEVWYREMPVCRFTLVSPDRHFVAGMIEDQSLIVLDSWTGELVDSIRLEQPLERWSLFETYDLHQHLNAVGMRSDTFVVYQFELSVETRSSMSAVEPELPPTFTLHQNFPNPFNGSTQLRFSSMESQRLSLKIFNVLGQEIATIAETVFGEGEYEMHWDATDDFGRPQASGIYFAQLRSGTQSQIIKLIYLK